MINYKKMHS